MERVIFACVHNAGRSQMAAAFFTSFADSSRAQATSAGTHPADHIHPEVIEVMREVGIDLNANRPQRLSADLARDASLLITMGCGDECPFVPGVERLDWPVADPKGLPLDPVRGVRDEIRNRVEALIEVHGCGAAIHRRCSSRPSSTGIWTRLSSRVSAVDNDSIGRGADGDGVEEIVSVHLSGEMSGTFESAQLAALEVDVPVHVVDSGQVGIATGFAALTAADVLDAGGGAKEAAQAALARGQAASSLFYVDTLEHLRRGGRVG